MDTCDIGDIGATLTGRRVWRWTHARQSVVEGFVHGCWLLPVYGLTVKVKSITGMLHASFPAMLWTEDKRGDGVLHCMHVKSKSAEAV